MIDVINDLQGPQAAMEKFLKSLGYKTHASNHAGLLRDASFLINVCKGQTWVREQTADDDKFVPRKCIQVICLKIPVHGLNESSPLFGIIGDWTIWVAG
jgi:hypothetical protein